MKKGIAGILSLVLVCIMLVESAQVAWATTQEELQNQIDSNQSQLDDITGQISSIESEQDILDEQIDDATAELVNLYTSIGVLEDQITDKEAEITDKEAEIDEAQTEYEAAEKEEQDQYEAMKLRIKFMYEQGDSTYLELLLSSDSLGDLLDKTEYIEDIYEYDRNMLEEYQETKQEVADMKVQLEDQKEVLEEDKTSLVSDKSDLESQQDYLNQVLDEKKAQSSDYESEIAQAQEQANSYKAQIAADNQKLEDMKEEERKKLAEEAAAAAAASASQSSSTSQSSSSGNASSASTIAAAQAIVASASGSDLGKSIATYACQYIGNPYVAGGTSLTEGADCSGFVYRIYADFGYSIPRTSYSLRSAGTGVSYSEAQPGDLICYDGHVAMYIGNGKIVHASSAKTGIKVSNAQYREILAVRRIIS